MNNSAVYTYLIYTYVAVQSFVWATYAVKDMIAYLKD